jgi:hypothetical protein
MTREEAAKILEKQFDESCGDYRYQNKDKLNYEDALWLAIAALREQREGKMDWISVKDRLPERDGESIYVECIVTIWHYGTDIFGESYERCCTTIAQFDTTQKIWSIGIDDISMHLNALIGLDDLSSDSSYISHWMPLPELPKEVKKA